MTIAEQILPVISSNSKITNSELAEAIEKNIPVVKATLSKMVKRGDITKTFEGGIRILKVSKVKNDKSELKEFKNESLLRTVKQLLEANVNETNSYEIRQNGALIVRILEKL